MKTIFFTIMVGLLISPCGNKNSEVVTIDDDTNKFLDSIDKADKLALKLLRQDSIHFYTSNGISVTMISGKHKYGGKTEIIYQSVFDLMKEEQLNGEKELLSNQEIKDNVNAIKSIYRGGLIRLDISRSTIGEANLGRFKIVLKDMNDNEITRFELEDDIPELPGMDRYWWNISMNGINSRIEIPFKVFIIDTFNDKPFEYLVDFKK